MAERSNREHSEMLEIPYMLVWLIATQEYSQVKINYTSYLRLGPFVVYKLYLNKKQKK
jgi:hypothetical protein